MLFTTAIMDPQVTLRTLIQSRFDESRRKNPSVSLRGFCRRHRLQPSIVSLLLLGKRKAGKKTAQTILNALDSDPQTRSEVLSAFAPAFDPELGPRPEFVQCSADQYRVIAEWYYMAILYLTDVRDFQSDCSWIAQRLGISESLAKSAVDRLLRLGFLRLQDGKWHRSEPYRRTTDDVQNPALRRSHDELLELARNSLHGDPIDRRDFTWLVLPMNSRKIDRAKELIRDFQDRFLMEMERDRGDWDQVYRLSMQFFPHTKENSS